MLLMEDNVNGGHGKYMLSQMIYICNIFLLPHCSSLPAHPQQYLVNVFISASVFTMLCMSAAAAYIINSTGGLRGEVVTPFFIAAAISDDGNTLAIGDDGTVLLYSWSTSSMSYVPLGSPLSPPSGGSWIVWDLQFGSLMDFTPVAVVGYISGDVLDIRVVGFNVKTFAAVTDWTGPRNTDNLQNNPSIRCVLCVCHT